MTKRIAVNHRLRLSMFLFFLVLLIFSTIGLAYADSGLSPDGMDQVAVKMAMIRTHVQKNGNLDPETADQLRQLEEKLRAGSSLKECCQFCHTDKIAGRRPSMPSSPGHSGPSRWVGEDER